ncbi:O-antigen ligase family protein [Vibrio sp. ZF57]|uniref:O-antigen ligase family protein n=1 Tax=Vibrio sp. ZF57 TaxID=1840084 RepID=UPI00148185E3|nr:O-antigen ligase family protein [Vibrio sp. ZF57]
MSILLIGYFEHKKINLHLISSSLLYIWSWLNIFLLFLFLIGLYIPPKGDFSGVFHDRNVYAISSVLVVIFYYCTNKFCDIKIGLLAKVTITTLLISILISKSVTGFIGIIVISIMVSQSKKTVSKAVAFFILISFLIAFFTIDNPLLERMSRFSMIFTGDYSQLNNNESAFLRFYLLESGWNLFIQYWQTGIGLDSARYYVFWPTDGRGTFLHNNYLDMATSGGLYVFILYFFPMLYVLFKLMVQRGLIRNRKLKLYWSLAFYTLLYKLLYNFTWPDYFEFGMVFFYILGVYSYFKFKILLAQCGS